MERLSVTKGIFRWAYQYELDSPTIAAGLRSSLEGQKAEFCQRMIPATEEAEAGEIPDQRAVELGTQGSYWISLEALSSWAAWEVSPTLGEPLSLLIFPGHTAPDHVSYLIQIQPG